MNFKFKFVLNKLCYYFNYNLHSINKHNMSILVKKYKIYMGNERNN